MLNYQKIRGYKIKEVTFCDGKTYKIGIYSASDKNGISSIRLCDGVESKYYQREEDYVDNFFTLVSIKKGIDGSEETKHYYPSNDIYKLITEQETNNGEDLSNYDLPEFIEFIVGIAKYKHTESSYEIYFVVNSDKELKMISDYYNLPFPLPEKESIDDGSGDWHSKDFDKICVKINPECSSKYRNDFKLGSIKFKNNKPKYLKMYKSNYKDREYAKRN